jgi:uncharacterized protein with HEPN domain
MQNKSPEPHLQDILDAIDHIYSKMRGLTLETFQGDLDRRRIVERNIEIISEASRRLHPSLKNRHLNIPWKKVAGIGNILRHDYENMIPDALWKLTHDDLPHLEKACKAELINQKSTKK